MTSVQFLPLNLNDATFEQLRDVGLSVTQTGRVLAHRERSGRFSSVDELEGIPGFPGRLPGADQVPPDGLTPRSGAAQSPYFCRRLSQISLRVGKAGTASISVSTGTSPDDRDRRRVHELVDVGADERRADDDPPVVVDRRAGWSRRRCGRGTRRRPSRRCRRRPRSR